VSAIDDLRAVILKLHGCEAVHVSTAPVREMFNGKTVWHGEVEIFDLVGHPKASQCYAWAYKDDGGQTQYTAVLRTPPVNSPQDAVRAAIVAQVKNERKKT